MGLPQHAYRWRVAAARLHHAHGDLEASLALLDEAEPFYNTDFSPSVRPVAAMKARVQVELGDLDAGLRWAADRQLAPDDVLDYVREFEHITLARILLVQASARTDDRALDQATGLLRRLLAAADEGSRGGTSIEILALLSVALRASGDEAGATAAMDDAVARAGHEGYVRTFLDARPATTEPLPPPGEEPRPTGPDDLSERELDVLRLLRSDLTGPDIARELLVSLNTLRTHTKHIYTKLGVNNRREAVSRAAELGL